MISNMPIFILDVNYRAYVKQILAFVLFLICITSLSANASEACLSLFQAAPSLKTNGFETSFSDYKKQNKEKFKSLIRNAETAISINIGEKTISKSELRDKLNVNKLFDRALLGPLGRLFDLKLDKINKKIKTVRNKFSFSEIEKETKATLEKIKTIDSSKYDGLFMKLLQPEEVSPNVIMIQISSIVKPDMGEVERAIQQRFQLLYYEMVNWNYRLSGLLENKTHSNLLLMDDVSVYANEMKYFDFTLVFDHKLWEVEKAILTSLIEQYKKTSDKDEQQKILIEIQKKKEPFLPMTGMAQAKHFFSLGLASASGLNHYPVELKRYFKNDLEDPLDLLNVDPKTDDFVIRHRMIYRTVEKLPVGTPLEIHAHSILHVRAYAKLGFKDTGLIDSEKFKESDIHLLKATREQVLDKIQTILDKNQ